MNNEKHIETILATQPRARNNKRLPTHKEKAFIKEYAKTLNGTQSALKVYDTNSANSASVIASDNLAKPRIRLEIERLLNDNGIQVDEVFSIHRRNMLQDKHLPTSQKAVDSFHELLGLKDTSKADNDVKVAFIIQK